MLINVKAAAAQLGIPRQYVTELIRLGKIEATAVGARDAGRWQNAGPGCYVMTQEAIDAYKKRREGQRTRQESAHRAATIISRWQRELIGQESAGDRTRS